MTHSEAWMSELRVRQRLVSAVSEPFRYPILSMVHHSTSPLEHLVEAASAAFNSQFYPGEELEYRPTDNPPAKPLVYINAPHYAK